MSWREAVRLSGVGFSELSVQAIWALRQGNLVPPGPAGTLAARARRRVVQSKGIISGVLALLALGAAFALRSSGVASSAFTGGAPSGVFDAGVLTGLFGLDLAFLWWTGMQVLPTFLSSGVLTLLETLPIDDRTLARTSGLLYLRLFDLPSLTILVATPVFVGLALGPWAGIAVVPGAVTVVGVALALSLLTGRFFVRRVQGARGGGTIVRWAYLTLWLVPAFAMFGFVVAAPAFFALLKGGAASGPSLAGDLLLVAFPFPLAALPATVASGPSSLGLDATGGLILASAVVGYLALGTAALYWVLGAVRRVGLVPPVVPGPARSVPLVLRPVGAALAVLTKDLRIASRTPGYAFLVLLPILDALVLGLWTYASVTTSTAAAGLGLAAVTTAALLATFFGPAFFAIEVFAYSYGRTLPLSDRSLLVGKVALIVLIYLIASTLVVGLTLARVFAPIVLVGFVAAELPAVGAAAFLELGILFRRARTRGLPITNLYTGAWLAFLVSIPGLLVASLPLVVYQADRLLAGNLRLLAMGLVALAELALSAPYALGREPS